VDRELSPICFDDICHEGELEAELRGPDGERRQTAMRVLAEHFAQILRSASLVRVPAMWRHRRCATRDLDREHLGGIGLHAHDAAGLAHLLDATVDVPRGSAG
jgi:hypothetical protein